MLQKSFSESELVLALVAAVGTELGKVRERLEERLRIIGYEVTHVRITKDVIPQIITPRECREDDQYERFMSLMDAGNDARLHSGDNSILALGAAGYLAGLRPEKDGEKPRYRSKHAYIISSLKHPEEVERLRAIYPQGFYLIGVYADYERRLSYLKSDKRVTEENAKKLIVRDEDEHLEHGQRVTDTFHLSDFFVRIDGDDDRLKKSLWRLLGLLFGHPYVTPTFDEYAMFLAFASSLHSADLSRQVGAVVAVEEQIVATGANDCPKAGGGQYWPQADKMPDGITFPMDGRDFALGHDTNKREQQRIRDEILAEAEELGLDREKLASALNASRLSELTEFGRVVHAEMEALLSCARAGIPVKGGTLYSTTFPCHNCAKHIVAAGIERVLFIEPYQKSKAIEFHTDSICDGFNSEDKQIEGPMVKFEPFVGVGPRRFFDLFSMRLGSGYRLRRKDGDGKSLVWEPEAGTLRLQMLPASYLDLELIASNMFNQARPGKQEADHGK